MKALITSLEPFQTQADSEVIAESSKLLDTQIRKWNEFIMMMLNKKYILSDYEFRKVIEMYALLYVNKVEYLLNVYLQSQRNAAMEGAQYQEKLVKLKAVLQRKKQRSTEHFDV